MEWKILPFPNHTVTQEKLSERKNATIVLFQLTRDEQFNFELYEKLTSIRTFHITLRDALQSKLSRNCLVATIKKKIDSPTPPTEHYLHSSLAIALHAEITGKISHFKSSSVRREAESILFFNM